MYNETIETEELKKQIEQIMLLVDELDNVEAAIFCSNEIIRRVIQKAVNNYTTNTSSFNDYSSFIPAY